MLNIHMAGMAENQGFAATRSHNLNPERFLSTVVVFQVFERPDVMYLYLSGHAGYSALFTHLGEEPLFQF